MIIESIEKVCVLLSSKPRCDRSDTSEITESLQGFGLTEAQAELALKFLKKYFLESDAEGRKVKLAEYAREIFQEKSLL